MIAASSLGRRRGAVCCRLQARRPASPDDTRARAGHSGEIRGRLLIASPALACNAPADPAGDTTGAGTTAATTTDASGGSGLSGFSTPSSITLDDNDALLDLSGLASLAGLDNSLYITNNDGLTSVAELSALTSVGGSLVVVSNSQLPQTDAVAWAASVTAGTMHKIAGNQGYGPPADPCPWAGDGACDEVNGGLGICADGSDSDGCAEGWSCE